MGLHRTAGFAERNGSSQLAQSLSEFSNSVYLQLSGMQKDIGLILGGLEHLGASVKRLETRIDNVETTLSARIDNVETKLSARIDDVETKLTARIDDVETKLTARIDDVETKLTARIDDVETKLSTRIDDVETKLVARIDSVDMKLTGRIDTLDKDVKSHKRLVLLVTGGLGAVAVLATNAQIIFDILVRLGLLRQSV